MARIKILLFLTVFLLMPEMISADENGEIIEEISDADLRENPDIEDARDDAVNTRVDVSSYPFLDVKNNVIELNGADLSDLIRAFAESEDRIVNIVHIGDSHIQADLATGRTRRLLQEHYGAAGRGLVVPLKLAGTNEPSDYSIKTDTRFDSERLLGYPWSSKMGFTGVVLTPLSSEFNFDISAKEPFERVKVYYHGNALNVNAIEYEGSSLIYASVDDAGCLEIGLPFPCEDVRLSLSALGQVSVYGFDLESDLIGVAYHAIGINGATYASYNRVEGLGEEISAMAPDLIIVSLGTNEAFGKFNSQEFKSQVDNLVKELSSANPEVSILLTTPSECYRRVRKGRRRTSYAINNNLALVRDVIADYGKDNGIPVYDWFTVAGGNGAASQWLSAGLLSRDRVHYSFSGYELAGQMLYDALSNLLENNPTE